MAFPVVAAGDAQRWSAQRGTAWWCCCQHVQDEHQHVQGVSNQCCFAKRPTRAMLSHSHQRGPTFSLDFLH